MQHGQVLGVVRYIVIPQTQIEHPVRPEPDGAAPVVPQPHLGQFQYGEFVIKRCGVIAYRKTGQSRGNGRFAPGGLVQMAVIDIQEREFVKLRVQGRAQHTQFALHYRAVSDVQYRMRLRSVGKEYDGTGSIDDGNPAVGPGKQLYRLRDEVGGEYWGQRVRGRQQPVGRRRILAPAFRRPVRPQPADGVPAGAYRRERAGWRAADGPIRAPAFDRAGGGNAAAVFPAQRDLSEKGCRRGRLAAGVIALAENGAVRAQSASVGRAQCQLPERAGLRVGAPVRVRPPAEQVAGAGQAAAVRPAGGDRSERYAGRRGGSSVGNAGADAGISSSISISINIPAPANRRAGGVQGAGVLCAGRYCGKTPLRGGVHPRQRAAAPDCAISQQSAKEIVARRNLLKPPRRRRLQ